MCPRRCRAHARQSVLSSLKRDATPAPNARHRCGHSQNTRSVWSVHVSTVTPLQQSVIHSDYVLLVHTIPVGDEDTGSCSPDTLPISKAKNGDTTHFLSIDSCRTSDYAHLQPPGKYVRPRSWQPWLAKKFNVTPDLPRHSCLRSIRSAHVSRVTRQPGVITRRPHNPGVNADNLV